MALTRTTKQSKQDSFQFEKRHTRNIPCNKIAIKTQASSKSRCENQRATHSCRLLSICSNHLSVYILLVTRFFFVVVIWIYIIHIKQNGHRHVVYTSITLVRLLLSVKLFIIKYDARSTSHAVDFLFVWLLTLKCRNLLVFHSLRPFDHTLRKILLNNEKKKVPAFGICIGISEPMTSMRRDSIALLRAGFFSIVFLLFIVDC